MLSDRLKEFLEVWCGIDADPADILESLQDEPPTDFAVWLQDDLGAAIAGGDLTPEVLARLTGLRLRTADEADAWLRECWEQWFPQSPYPADGPEGLD